MFGKPVKIDTIPPDEAERVKAAQEKRRQEEGWQARAAKNLPMVQAAQAGRN